MMVGKKHPAVLWTLPCRGALGDLALDHHPLRGTLPPDRGPSVARIMKNRTDKLLRRQLPHQPGGSPLTLVDGQFQGPPLDPETGLADAACLTKEPKHLLDPTFKGVWYAAVNFALWSLHD